jgi:hypothetical protein
MELLVVRKMEMVDDDLDLDWGNIPDYEQENRDFFNSELSREVRLNPDEHDMVVRKTWAEYAKEINLMRAQLRYMKKSIMYRGGGWACNVEENRRDIIEQEKRIQRLCKLRDCAKAMEKAAGFKMGEMKKGR